MADMLEDFRSIMRVAAEGIPGLVSPLPGAKLTVMSASGFVAEVNRVGLLVKSPHLVSVDKTLVGMTNILGRTLEFLISQDLRQTLWNVRKEKLEQARWTENNKLFSKSFKATRFMARMKILEVLFGGIGGGGGGGGGVGAGGLLAAGGGGFLSYLIGRRAGPLLKFILPAVLAAGGLAFLQQRMKGKGTGEALLGTPGQVLDDIMLVATTLKSGLTTVGEAFSNLKEVVDPLIDVLVKNKDTIELVVGELLEIQTNIVKKVWNFHAAVAKGIVNVVKGAVKYTPIAASAVAGENRPEKDLPFFTRALREYGGIWGTMYEQGKLWLEREPVVRQDKSRVSRSPFDRIRTGASDVGNAALLASKKPWSVIKTDTRTTANSLEENFRNRTTAEADVSRMRQQLFSQLQKVFKPLQQHRTRHWRHW